MQSLAEDVPHAITQVLSTHDRQARKQLIDKVFVDEVRFWHLFHDCKSKRELFGVYQMWGAYNFHIGVEYQRVIPDRKRQLVVVDLIETIYVWWTPLPYLLIPQHLNLHVVLGVQKDPDGQLRFTYQEDHIFWVESLLGSNPILTLGLGPFFMTYVRPLAGALYAQVGNAFYARLSDAPGHAQPTKTQQIGFTNTESELHKAICVAYGGNSFARWEMSQRVYADQAEFIHTLFTVKGKKNIFGAHNFWNVLNRKTEAKVKRLICAEREDLVLIDLEQQCWPYLWWPAWGPLAIWVHVILTLENASSTSNSKVIVKHEDHVLWVESLMLRNLGPLSRLYDHTIRRLNGLLFSFIGNTIYVLLEHLAKLVASARQHSSGLAEATEAK